MGFSTTFSEVIFLIASVVLASGTSAYILYMGGLLQSNMLQIVSDVRTSLSIQVEIVYATVQTSPQPHFILYVKNVGKLPIVDYESLDVYVGEYGKAVYFRFSSTPSDGFFTVEDSDGDGVWEVGETAVIRAYTSDISGQVFEARVKPFKSIASIYVFPSPP
ncbi:MAG: hypothetical protein DRJ18_01865 [Candidatus Methanomethylicota archaeon]|nr:MAG: hypothetical protein DRJ18_01865 [Candidatus Verstraetearchaeota archaeon]